jgi:predicted  nucleic acid-binding Zn-ribbon protein
MCNPETLNQILESIAEFKDEIKALRVEFQRVHEEFEQLKQLIIEGNGKHIREINTALQTMAALWLRMDRLESKLQEFRSSFSALENDAP